MLERQRQEDCYELRDQPGGMRPCLKTNTPKITKDKIDPRMKCKFLALISIRPLKDEQVLALQNQCLARPGKSHGAKLSRDTHSLLGGFWNSDLTNPLIPIVNTMFYL